MFRSVDLAVPQLKALGVKMFVVDANCRYMAPLLYDHELSVKAWFLSGSPLIRVAYDVYNLDTDRWAARATTALASTDGTGKLHTTTPEGILDRIPIS
ncbi:MAG: acyl-CoA thioesterase FadM [Hyphomicrobiaceae bacterium]